MKKLTIALVCMAVIGCAIPMTSAGPLADYGDAPDNTTGQVFAYPGVEGQFPSLYATANTIISGRRCPFHLNTSEEWLGTGASSTTTVEADAQLVDLDSDDSKPQLWFDPDTGMGVFIVPVTVAAGAPDVLRYINILYDRNQDGVWQNPNNQNPTWVFPYPPPYPEWVVVNEIVSVPSGQTRFYISNPFPVDTPLPNPIWIRVTLTREKINSTLFESQTGWDGIGWDGSGPAGGFGYGETEDWLLTDVDTNPPNPTGWTGQFNDSLRPDKPVGINAPDPLEVKGVWGYDRHGTMYSKAKLPNYKPSKVRYGYQAWKVRNPNNFPVNIKGFEYHLDWGAEVRHEPWQADGARIGDPVNIEIQPGGTKTIIFRLHWKNPEAAKKAPRWKCLKNGFWCTSNYKVTFVIDPPGDTYTYNVNPVYDWNCSEVESSDAGGTKKDIFQESESGYGYDGYESVYAYGYGYVNNTIYDIYIVEDRSWNDGATIPTRVAGTVETVTTDEWGNIPTGTLIWSSPVIGEYDIIVDIDGNGTYDECIDALDDMDVNNAGFKAIPIPTLTSIGLIALIGLLSIVAAMRIKKR